MTRSGRSPEPAEGPTPWDEPWPADEASDDYPDPALRHRLVNGFPDYGAEALRPDAGHRAVNGYNGHNGYNGSAANGYGGHGAHNGYNGYAGRPDPAPRNGYHHDPPAAGPAGPADLGPAYPADPGWADDEPGGYPPPDHRPRPYPPGSGVNGYGANGHGLNGHAHGRDGYPADEPGWDDGYAGAAGPGATGAGYPAGTERGYPPAGQQDGWQSGPPAGDEPAEAVPYAGWQSGPPPGGRVSPAYPPYPDPAPPAGYAGPPAGYTAPPSSHTGTPTGYAGPPAGYPARPEPPGPELPAYPVQPELPRARRAAVEPQANHAQPVYPADPSQLPVVPQQPYADEATEVLRRYVPANELLNRERNELGTTRQGSRKHPTRAVARRRARRRRALEWPFLVAFALVAAFLIRTFAVQTFYIPSGSMHETLLEGDRVLVNKIGYHMHEPNRGDVIVFRRPPDFEVEDDDLIKRVIALPGETVQGQGRKVLVNGKALTEPYVEPACGGTEDFAPVTVPPGHLWVMGDNRCDSSDSRVFGPIDEGLLVGRAFVLVWPTGRIAWL